LSYALRILENKYLEYQLIFILISFLDVTYINPRMLGSISKIDYLGKILIKSYLEEYFGLEIQIKVVDFDF